MRRPLIVAFVVTIIVLPVTAQLAEREMQGERILHFDCDVTIHKDTTLTVVETITVQCESDKIRRGIFRDFPTRYMKKWWMPVIVQFEIQSLTRNGSSEPYRTESLSNGVRTYFGSEDVMLPIGQHTYVFTYNTDRQLGYFEDFDELYWNATGNDWDFPIDYATATIRLPESVSPSNIKTRGYTGPQGSKEEDYEATVREDGSVEFRATRPLGVGEGLTVAVGFPKGIVTAPEPRSIGKEVVRGILAESSRLTGLFLVIAYFVVVWFLVGRDPAPGQIVPQSAPPEGVSPAAARFIDRMGFDHTAFTAALVSLAVKGFVRIEEDDDTFRVFQENPPSPELPPEERTLMKKLLPSGKSISFKRSSHKRISSAIQACQESMRLAFEKTYFVTNFWYWLPGLILSIVVVVGAVLSLPRDSGAPVVFLAIWLSIWTIGVIALAMQVFTLWKQVLTGKGGIVQALFMTVFATPFFIAEIVVGGIFIYKASWVVVVLLPVLGVANIMFCKLLRAPTILGRKTLDLLDGYKLYLTGGRPSRYGGDAENVSPELYEEHLAYAIALGIEDDWSKRFESVLGATSTDPDAGRPRWYHGDGWHLHRPAMFATALGASLTASVASSSTAPGSSSGSSSGGGGGSSGGGGGGGGGGGW